MSCRLAVALLLASSTVAMAEDNLTALVPSCAQIDTTRDTLDATARAAALQQLTRTLERADLLVVSTGCVEAYVVSHERGDTGLVIRIAGPHGARRMRNVPLDQLAESYGRMVDSLLEPPAPDAAAAPAASADEAPPDESSDADPDVAWAEPTEPSGPSEPAVDAVALEDTQIQPERMLYAQLLVGNYGVGYGVGYRRDTTLHSSIDFSLGGTSGDSAGQFAFGVKMHYVSNPTSSTTTYIGGGMSMATQTDGYGSGSGLRAELSAGLAIGRSGPAHLFMQANLAMPLFTMTGIYGEEAYTPLAQLAMGLGF